MYCTYISNIVVTWSLNLAKRQQEGKSNYVALISFFTCRAIYLKSVKRQGTVLVFWLATLFAQVFSLLAKLLTVTVIPKKICSLEGTDVCCYMKSLNSYFILFVNVPDGWPS